VIEDPDVTAVIVSTSEGEHMAPMLAAIERGKPVLVEKPIALTVREADRVLEALAKFRRAGVQSEGNDVACGEIAGAVDNAGSGGDDRGDAGHAIIQKLCLQFEKRT
jgi:hypothetical protein